MEESRIEVEGITVSHPSKVLFPGEPITKAALAEYYSKIAPWMLPELKGRPVSLVRCPSGRSKKCFFQKHPDEAMAAELKSVPIREKEGKADYVVIENAHDLIYLVQMNVLEIHCWGCRLPKLETPDRIIFDLDPDKTVPVKQVIRAAEEMREFLQAIKLESLVKTSGGKGLHVVVPIRPKLEWDDVKLAAATIATAFTETNPKLYIANMSLKKRTGKIFIDYLRNGRGSTSIANYSTRARENAPIATPLDWKELKTLRAFNEFTVSNIFKRLSNKSFTDPWGEIDSMKQHFPVRQ